MDTRTNLNVRKTFRRLGGPHINVLRILRLVCVPIAKFQFMGRFTQSMCTELNLHKTFMSHHRHHLIVFCHLHGQFRKKNRVTIICAALPYLVLFVQFKKREKTHGGVILLKSEVCNFTKSSPPPWVFFTFFKLYEWYQIVQSITFSLPQFFS